MKLWCSDKDISKNSVALVNIAKIIKNSILASNKPSKAVNYQILSNYQAIKLCMK